MSQEARAYVYGTYLGDGFISCQGNSYYLSLKVCDVDFAEEFARCLKVVYPGRHISEYWQKENKPNRRPRKQIKINGKDIYHEFLEGTVNKSKIPNWIVEDKSCWKPFLRGIMDSEGWVGINSNRHLTMMSINVAFAMKAPFVGGIRQMFEGLGVRVASDRVKDDLRTIHLNPLDYINSGISFSIERKRNRLEYVGHILNDFTRNYPAIKYNGKIDDKVWSEARASECPSQEDNYRRECGSLDWEARIPVRVRR